MKKERLSLMEIIYIVSTIFLFLLSIYTFVFLEDAKTGKTLFFMSIISLIYTAYMIQINRKIQS